MDKSRSSEQAGMTFASTSPAREATPTRTATPGAKRGFPKIRGSCLGVPIIRIIAFQDACWVPPLMETPDSDGQKDAHCRIG